MGRSPKEKSPEIPGRTLKDRRAAAHRNAARLLELNPSPLTNPSTNVHLLVAALERLQKAASDAA